MSKTFAFHEHQNKGIGLVKALRALGWTPATENPDLFLIDFDGRPYYQELIARFAEQGATVLLYPHGATAQLCLDIWQVSPGVSGYLAFSAGQAEILRRFDFPRPVAVTGWYWCEQLPPRKLGISRAPGRVLFAPIHPLGNGFLHPLHLDANARAFADILDHFIPERVSVRLLGTPEQNGLGHPVAGVEYHQAALDNSAADIDRADLVVSYGTFGYLSVARGLPTVMYAQDYPLPDGETLDATVFPRHWHDYAEFMRYPVQTVADLTGSEQAIADWRAEFIGEQMTPETLDAAISELMWVPA